MNDKFECILSSLPEKPPRSRLAPYYALIEELRRRGCTYREIERILVDQCQFKISRSAINNFMRSQARNKPKVLKRHTTEHANKRLVSQTDVTDRDINTSAANQDGQPEDDVLQRIAALKMRPKTAPKSSKLFQYDPNEPLRIEGKAEKENPGE
jgi:hypothetical protein